MKKSFYLFAAFCLFSCSNKTYPRFDYNISKNPWIDAFKDHVFFASLNESYKSDSIITLLQKKNAFNPYDGLSLKALQKARELGINLVKKCLLHQCVKAALPERIIIWLLLCIITTAGN
jgi:hypothetical protein